MTTKEWFEKVRETDKEIRALKREFLIADEFSEESTKTGACVLSLKAYEGKLFALAERLFSEKTEIFRVIIRLEKTPHRTILSLRYLTLLTWEEIAEEMDMSLRHIYRLHNEALVAAEKIVEQL
ncbi:MAG: DUF1492 domain-containing protein [Clostridia bacterium]|nr:DUF1492 domain-containing protein [Clostridia bacterium]